MKITSKERLNKLKKHIKNLKEIDKLKREYTLGRISKGKSFSIPITARIKQEDYKKILIFCKNQEIKPSAFIRNLIKKELLK